MRVLHVYSGNLYGGIETMLVTLARHRDLCPEMEPHFALCFEGRLSEELTNAGVPVHKLGNVRVSHPSSVRKARRALAEVLRNTNFDVVVCHAAWPQAIFGTIARKAGLPLVFWLHDATDGKHWLERWARRTPPDLAICNSRYTASKLKNLYSNVRAEVIYCPVAFTEVEVTRETRSATRAELNTPDEAIVIIQVSRMEKIKGHALHLEALSLLGDLSGWVCWVIGGAQRPHEVEYYDELKRIAERAGITMRVCFLGERADVAGLMAASDIYCQPNQGPEGFGLTFVEALGASLPVVTTSIGGACEIVDSLCGILVQPNDAQELAAALQSLINEPGLRAAMGAVGKERARRLCDPMTKLDDLQRALNSLFNHA